jgi:ABC-2 type transport system ATP-binding protein
VAFVREGELVAVEDVAELTGRAVREIEVTFAAPVPVSAFAGVDGVTAVTANGAGPGLGTADAHALRLTVSGSLDATVKMLARYEVVTMTSREPDLEDIFLAFYGGRLGHEGVTASKAEEEAGDAA